MTSRIITNPHGVPAAIQWLGNHPLPLTMTLEKGRKRSNDQNRLQRKWMNEAAEQLPDHTAEEYRGYCKLHFGVAILKNANEEFAQEYDKHIKPHTYEFKLALMQEPFDFSVTRLMTTKQKKQYLDAVYQHFTGLGVQLTMPEERG